LHAQTRAARAQTSVRGGNEDEDDGDGEEDNDEEDGRRRQRGCQRGQASPGSARAGGHSSPPIVTSQNAQPRQLTCAPLLRGCRECRGARYTAGARATAGFVRHAPLHGRTRRARARRNGGTGDGRMRQSAADEREQMRARSLPSLDFFRIFFGYFIY
jgi:hypothetical protein